jgi:tetratricopeptide (TPR) repeat protein
MEPLASTGLNQDDDFLHLFTQEIGPYAPWIDVRKQDLRDYRWDEGPIEILFVDAAKSWELLNAIFRGFGPFLVPGRSRVVLQDFRFDCPWLPLAFDSRPDIWEEVEDVDNGWTVAFTPLKPLAGPAGIHSDYSEEAFPLQSADRILRDRIDREEPSKRSFFLKILHERYLSAQLAGKEQSLTSGVLHHGLTVDEMALLRPWSQVCVPAEVDRIPSMLSKDEKQYLIWLTEEKYEGWGAIVELGVWLGSSSAALAEGLRRRNSTAEIHSLDLFRWEDYMTAQAGPVWKIGEDFLPFYLKQTSDYASWIKPRKLDLMEAAWDGGPIEILFVDSAKSWELANAILNGFARHLVPGRSRIVLQDFRFHYAHCLPLIFDSRPDLWKQVEDVQYSTTVSFMPLKPLFGPCGIDSDYAEESFPLKSAEILLRGRMAREEPFNRHRVLQALYRKYLIDGPLEESLKLRAEVVAGGIDETNLKSMESVNHILCGRGWKAMSQGDFKMACELADRCISIEGAVSVYPPTLLGFARLRLGDMEGANLALQQILLISPDFPSGRLLGVEIALSEARYEEAAAQALAVLSTLQLDESTVHWTLCLLFRAWTAQGLQGTHLPVLAELAASLSHSPAFLTHLATEQFYAGEKAAAMENVHRALALAPDYPFAAACRDQWSAFTPPVVVSLAAKAE